MNIRQVTNVDAGEYLTAGLSVLHADGVEALSAGGVGLIHGKDSMSGGGYLLLQHIRRHVTSNP